MLTLVAQPFRRGLASASPAVSLTGRRVIGGLLELCSLAAILGTLASAVVRIH